MTFRWLGFLWLAAAPAAVYADSDAPPPLLGYSVRASSAQVAWERKFRDAISPAAIRENMRRLSARPHHVGSPYDKDNAEWILSKFKEWGFEAKIETFNVLFPTPKARLLEMVGPTPFKASLQEPVVQQDPTTDQTAEQLPTYNAYSADGAAGLRQLRQSRGL